MHALTHTNRKNREIKSTRPCRKPGERTAARSTIPSLSGTSVTDTQPVKPQQAGVELCPIAATEGWFISLSNWYLGYWGQHNPGGTQASLSFSPSLSFHIPSVVHFHPNTLIFSFTFQPNLLHPSFSILFPFICNTFLLPLLISPCHSSHIYIGLLVPAFTSLFDPPVLLNHLSCFLPLIFLSSSNNFLCRSLPAHYCSLSSIFCQR